MAKAAAQLVPLVPHVTNRLGISRGRAYELAREGVLPVVRLGKQVRIDPERLEEWIASGGSALPGGWRKEPEQ